MIDAQAVKSVAVVYPAAIVNNTSVTSQALDTTGFEYATIDYVLGSTDIALSALSLTECATSGGSYTPISNSAPSVLPTATDDNKIWRWEIDLGQRQTFLKIVATFGNGSLGGYSAAIAHLSRAKDAPSTATEKGVAAVVQL